MLLEMLVVELPRTIWIRSTQRFDCPPHTKGNTVEISWIKGEGEGVAVEEPVSEPASVEPTSEDEMPPKKNQNQNHNLSRCSSQGRSRS